MQRQIILDTETTGIRAEEGHRVIELGCVEMINRKLTGRHLHHYINPEREIEAGAFAVHGISNEFLRDKPLFAHIAKEFVDFVDGAELIIHNAPFDVGFLDQELNLTRQGWKRLNDYCSITDTLPMARKMHVGQRNSLDALCKRYAIDNSKREWHGALMDAHLLAQVYLAMTGGQGTFFDALTNHDREATTQQAHDAFTHRSYQLTVMTASEDELNAHQAYLQLLKKQGQCLWPEDEKK